MYTHTCTYENKIHTKETYGKIQDILLENRMNALFIFREKKWK